MAARLRLTVTRGPDTGLIFVLGERDRAVVGRTPECRVPLRDTHLSRRHFEVVWDGSTARMLDLGSTNGTRVNGEVVSDRVLHPGDEIEAGDTLLRVEVLEEAPFEAQPFGPVVPEPRNPHPARARGTVGAGAAAALPGNSTDSGAGPEAPVPPAGRDSAGPLPIEIYAEVEPSSIPPQASDPPPGSLLARLAAVCAPEAPGRVFALVDGAQAAELALRARTLGHRLYTLFEGDLALHVASAGPILIPLEATSIPFLAAWVEAAGSNAGLLIETQVELESLHDHLRRVFETRDEEGRPNFFRFYDPRVLRGHLAACPREALRGFFGPVTGLLVEDEKGEGIDRLALEEGGAGGVVVKRQPI